MEVVLHSVSGVFDPLQMTFWRFFVGGLFLTPFALSSLKKTGYKIGKKDIGYCAFLGLMCVVIAMSFYQMGVTWLPAGVVAVIFSANPIFVVFLSAVLLGEKLTWQRIAAVLAALAGILLIISPWNTDLDPKGQITSVLGAAFFALYSVCGKRQNAKTGGLVTTWMSFLCGSTLLLVLLLCGNIPVVSGAFESMGLGILADVPLLSGFSISNLHIVLYVFIGVTGTGFASYFMAIDSLGAGKASMVFLFKTILAPLLAYFILGDPIGSNMVGGMILVAGASILMLMNNFKPSEKRG